MKSLKLNAAILFLAVAVIPAKAAISLDRTRAIYNGGEKSLTLNISNENKQLPFLAQSWLENEKMEKIITGPLVVTPPVQRVEPASKSLIRVSTTPEVNKLPQDRESLFYFNLREIPPKSDKPNVLQIALQTKIKLFYRPESIKTKPDEVWQNKIVLHKEKGHYRIENPTPYYVTIVGFAGSKNDLSKANFDSIMIAPKSTEKIKSVSYSTPWMTYINDYGGRVNIAFQCDGMKCTARKDS